MGALPMVLELVLVFVATGCLLHKYGDWRRQHAIVSLSVFLGWFFAFSIVFLLPLDVALTFYQDCSHVVPSTTTTTTTTAPQLNVSAPDLVAQDYEGGRYRRDLRNISNPCVMPGSYVSPATLREVWRVVYWTSQALTWLVLPLMQTYSTAGEFSVAGKLRRALFENVVYYASYLLILALLLIYAAVKGISLEIGNLKTIAITASNTWGLFLLVLLLGYGLVEVPRQMWHSGTKGTRLQKTYFEIEKLSAEKNDAEETVREAYKDTQAVLEALRNGHPYKDKAMAILAKFPPELTSRLDGRGGVGTGGGESRFRDTDAANLTSTSEKALVRLHKRVIDALQAHHRTQAQWKALVATALHLEEVGKNESTATHEFVHSYPVQQSQIEIAVCSPSIEWWWECRLKRGLLKALAVVLAGMTGVIVWSECTFFVQSPVLSLAAISVNLAATNYHYAYIQVSSILVIAYMCVCAYYTVFKLKIYRYYHLDPHHETDEKSLLFSAILLCRLNPPLCLNFLGMLHLDSHLVRQANAETAFTSIMGHMDLIKVVASGFNIYFPILILLLCLATYFRLGTRLLHQLGIDQFVGDDDMTHDMVIGGKALIQTERNRLAREHNREYRRDYLQSAAPKPQHSRSFRHTPGNKPPELELKATQPHSEYSDRSPIVAGMEQERYDEERIDSQPHSPPKGIFDDM